MRTCTENDARRDRQAINQILDILTERIQLTEAEHRADRSRGRYDDAALGIRVQTRLEQLATAIRDGLFDRLAADPATEAFVDAADAERYAQRAEYVDYAEAADVREIERDGERAWLIDQFDAALAAGKAMDAAEAAESGEAL